MSAAPVKPGDLLAGKYLVDRVLGQGGMGVVVAARHVELDERVAIKFLLPEFASDGEVVARFLREGRATVKIRSEHVVRVSDVGRLANGSPYMVMEYLDGSDLGEVARRLGPLPIDESALYVLQACEALAEAHALGIIHRDLKPPNLFLTHRADGSACVKVLDFGIAKFSRDNDLAAITRTSGMMGSALYMSPEQLRSAKDVDARADIWAIGVVLFELLTGKKPFVAEAFPQLVAQILEGEPTRLRTLRQEAPAELEAVIACCLEKRRESRFRTVAALASAILPFAGRAGQISVDRISKILHVDLGASTISVPSVGGSSDAAPLARTVATGDPAVHQTDGAWGKSQPFELRADARKSKAPLLFAGAIAGALVVLIAGAAALLYLRTTDPSRSPAATASRPSPPESTVPARPETDAAASTVAPAPSAPSPSSAASASVVAPTASAIAPKSTSLPKPPLEVVKKPPLAPNCDPPTFVGDDGLQHFKPECK